MARRPSTTTDEPKPAADTLEQQAATDSDLDEHGLERLPSFDEVPGQNGHVGVRPSERCGTPSGLGISCDLKDEHSGRHSWQAETSDSDASNEGEKAEQPALPGTPDPEKTDYDVPFEAQFNGKDLMTAPGLKAIGKRLIDSEESFDHLRDVDIRYFWRRRGGTQGGNPRYGKIKRPSVYESHFTGGTVVYLAELAADHIREAKFTDEQIEACLFEQLCRTDVDPDDHDAYRIIGPDFVGSIRTLQRFGIWSQDLREAAAHIQQLPLVVLAAEAEVDDE